MTAKPYLPFQMPDFKSRPDGVSRSLKEAYAFLRERGFPDKDLFIYPEGEFSSFKGEILDQRPASGEIISEGMRITLIAAIPGLCELMPDLFTDHREDFLEEEFNTRGGARRLFGIFDSAMIKMLCRLDWIRDIYGGIGQSEIIISYMGSLLNLPERNLKQISPEILGYVLPSLYGYLGTEEAMGVYLESVMGIETQAHIRGNQEYPLPAAAQNRLGKRGHLGGDLYLGQDFKGGPNLEIDLLVDSPETIEKIIPQSDGDFLLRRILAYCVPQAAENYALNIVPDPEKIRFKSGASHLGYGTVLGELPE